MAGRAAYGMHKARVSIYCDVRFRPEVPLIAFLARMRLRVALAVFDLGGTRHGNQGRFHCAALPEQQALAASQIIDSGQDGIAQLVFLQPVAKPKNGALIGQAGKLVRMRPANTH